MFGKYNIFIINNTSIKLLFIWIKVKCHKLDTNVLTNIKKGIIMVT